MDAGSAEYLEANRRSWDERTGIHVSSDFYDVDGFVAGASTLRPFEPDEMGDVTGCSFVHLQCHFGLDTLSWARRGASVTGLDFSAPAIDAARDLARRCEIDATFVHANVYDAPAALGRRFDVVYTGLGAINWLPDLARWAAVVADLLEPGGRFYLLEFHPVGFSLSDDDLTFDPKWGYFFDPAGIIDDDDRDYADADARLTQTGTYEWSHHLGEVISALANVGLIIERLSEFDEIGFARFPFLERIEGPVRRYRLPRTMPRIPLEYSILARKPLAPLDGS